MALPDSTPGRDSMRTGVRAERRAVAPAGPCFGTGPVMIHARHVVTRGGAPPPREFTRGDVTRPAHAGTAAGDSEGCYGKVCNESAEQGLQRPCWSSTRHAGGAVRRRATAARLRCAPAAQGFSARFMRVTGTPKGSGRPQTRLPLERRRGAAAVGGLQL